MVFVTVGTHHQPFERLMRGLEALDVGDLVVQHGHARPPAGARRAVPFMTFPEVVDHLEAADAVITHAGVGSVLCARNAGHVPLVVPRLKHYGEHVDDHQLELIGALERDGIVIVAREVDELPGALARVPARRAVDARRPGPLHEAVARELRRPSHARRRATRSAGGTT